MHKEAHPLANGTVTIEDWVTDPVQGYVVPGAEYRLEDWWDRLTGSSWLQSAAMGNIAAIQYAARAKANNLPKDDEVVYGKIGPFGHLVHVSEIRSK